MGAYSIAYLQDANDLMRLLAEEVVNKNIYDFDYFFYGFMNSDYRLLLDKGASRIINMTYDELFEYLLKEKHIFRKGKFTVDYLQAGWILEMYNNIQFQLKISSKDLLKIICLDDMKKYFRAFHELDEQVALEKIMNNIKKGGHNEK